MFDSVIFRWIEVLALHGVNYGHRLVGSLLTKTHLRLRQRCHG